MATGNGAHVVHRMLERHLDDYTLIGYNPLHTLFPFTLPGLLPKGDNDILHTNPDHAIFFRQKGLPLVVSFQNYVLDRWMGNYSTVLQRLHYLTDLRLFTRRAVSNAAALTAVSEFTAKLVRKDLNLNKPIQVIYNAVDEELFQPPGSRKINTKDVKVFFSGNLTRRKGAQWLTAIADNLEDGIRIHYTQGLRTRKRLPPHPRLVPVGPVPFEDMPARYGQMDILLMPTVREGFSLSVLEAMACGLPVVASNCSSLPEQIDAGRGGYLCPVGDVKRFADRLNHLADSPRKIKEMGQYNRSKIEANFSIRSMVDHYRQLFQGLFG